MVPSVYTGEMLTLCVCLCVCVCACVRAHMCVCETENQCCHHFINFCSFGTATVNQRTSVLLSVILLLAFLKQRNCIFSVDF
jgi:hypothetical protein